MRKQPRSSTSLPNPSPFKKDEVSFNEVITSTNISITALNASGNRCLGVINLDEHPSVPLHWWLARLKVDDRAQNRGLGSQLLNKALDTLERMGVPGLIVAPGGYGSDVGELEKWYCKRGFVKHPEGYLLWQPRSAK